MNTSKSEKEEDAYSETAKACKMLSFEGKLQQMDEGRPEPKGSFSQVKSGKEDSTDQHGSSDEILSGIQPLPEQGASPSPGVRSRVGAYAITSPYRPTDHQSNALSPRPDIDLEACVDGNSLVEAELVDNDVVHAEKLKDTPSSTNKTRWLLSVACLVILVLILVVALLSVSLAGSETDMNSSSDLSSSSYSEIPTPSPTNTPTSAPTCPQCFETEEELYNAVTAYYEDQSPNSSIALQYGHPIGTWSVSQIARFNFLFSPTNRSDSVRTSNLSISEEAIAYATSFSDDLGSWDMSGARQLEQMFSGMQNISSALGIQDWDVSNTKYMRGLFKDTHWAQEDPLNLSSWNTSQVRTFNHFFQYSNVQKAGIANWNTSSLLSLWEFAEGATEFNEDIGNWNVERITSMASAFEGASSFNADLSRWKTHSLNSLNLAFNKATSFNQPLQDWDVSRVDSLGGLFQGSIFNQPLEQWDVSECTITRQAFGENPAFNQPLANWDVSRVVDARWMFKRASNFSQDLCSWASKMPPHADVKGMFKQTNCPNTSDPILEEGGPFCFNCNP